MKNNIEDIIGRPAALEQLAEECAELGKAALKLSRILRGENPTPVKQREAEKNLAEEYTDVVQVAKWLGLNINAHQMVMKELRFEERIKAIGKENPYD